MRAKRELGLIVEIAVLRRVLREAVRIIGDGDNGPPRYYAELFEVLESVDQILPPADRTLDATSVLDEVFEALKFYSTKGHYRELCFNNPENLPYGNSDFRVMFDGGEKANVALAGLAKVLRREV